MPREFFFKGLTKPDIKMINFSLNAEGNTYLHELCLRGAPVDLVREAVVSLGADLQALNRKDLPPLGLAIWDGNLEVVQCLIDLGAELYFPVGAGRFFNAAAEAASWGRDDVLALILKNGGGVHLNQPGLRGESCLATALKEKYYRLIGPLVEAGAFINQESGKSGLTPLLDAARGNSPEVVEQLISLGAKLEQRQSSTGMTALHYAVSDGDSSVVERLLKLGADPNALTASGLTPLMISADRGNFRIAELLIEAGADVNYRHLGGERKTALHIAAKEGNDAVVVALLKGGADPLLTDAFNRTAARQAFASGRRDAARMLEEAERKAEQEFFEKAYNRLRR